MGPDPLPWKTTSGYRFPGIDPLEKQLDPLGSIASRGRYLRPSVKYVDTCMTKQRRKKRFQDSPWRNFLDPRISLTIGRVYFQLCVCLEFSLF